MSAPKTGKADTAEVRLDAELDAGVVAPRGTATGERRDRLVARTYAHPALQGRSVVRLTTETLGRAEDLTLGFLGFAEPGSSAEVGVVRQQALGFPAWALVHDPANGHHALDLIKDIEKYARSAATKPGVAKDGFDRLAQRLADAVPHFLPTYYEQAARAFLAVENAAYATSYFTRAREAEQSYGLAIDEDALAGSFLEFALAGALSVKSLTGYAKGLSERLEPQEAYERYRRVCVERVAGGLPPQTNLPRDLRRLAKAAGRDTVEEAVALARDLLPLSAMSRASTGFWTAYRADLMRAARADAQVRGLMLRVLPAFVSAYEKEEYGLWLEYLEEAGATAGLTEPVEKLDPAELPAEDAGRWLEQYARKAGHWEKREHFTAERPGRNLLRLVERMADRLRATDRPLGLADRNRGDIDLIDLCLDSGVAVADPLPKFDLSVAEWFGSGSRRQLTAIAGDPRFRPYLLRSIEQVARGGEVLVKNAEEAGRSDGMRSVLAEWLDGLGERTAEAGLADLNELLDLWLRNAQPALLALNLQAVRAVAGTDVSFRLGHALRSGIFDEYGWPLLEDLCAEFSGAKPGAAPEPIEPPKEQRVIEYRAYAPRGPRWYPVSQWPYLIVKDGENIVVLGADEEAVGYRNAPAFTKQERVFYRFVDGRLLIGSRTWSGGTVFYADDPLRVLDNGPGYQAADQEESLPIPGGGRTFGGTPLLSGDGDWSVEGPVAGDGTDFWTLVGSRFWSGHGVAWTEFDPHSGKLGRASVPAFFERDAPAGSVLGPRSSWLVPDDAEYGEAPIGKAGGLIGSRMRVLEDGTRVCTGVDGREQRLPQVPYGWGGQGVRALLDVPGAPGRYLAVIFDDGRSAPGMTMNLVADGTRRTAVLCCGAQATEYARGTWCVPPLPYWSRLTVRDEAGSAALRALSPELGAALLESGGLLDRTAAVEVVGSLLPQVTDERLRAGIAGYVTVAGECVKQLRKLRLELAIAADEPGAREAAAAVRAAPETPTMDWNEDFLRIRSGLATHVNRYGPIRPGHYFSLLGRAFTGRPTKEDATELGTRNSRVLHEFLETAVVLPALAVRAVSPAYTDRQRSDLLEVLSLAADSGLRAPGSALRALRLVPVDSTRHAPSGTLLDTEHGRVLILDPGSYHHDADKIVNAWEWSRDGEFGAIPGWNIRRERRSLPWPCAEPFGVFAEQARARGPVRVRPEPAADLAARTGLGELEAAVVLAGLPTLSSMAHERIPADMAAALGSRTAALTVAGGRFERLPAGTEYAEFLSLLLPERIGLLWERGPRTEAVAEFWVKYHGLLDPLPEWLRERAEKEFVPGVAQVLLNPDVAASIRSETQRETGSGLGLAARGVLWLAFTLPVGDPLRARLPKAVARMRQDATAKGFYVTLGYVNDVHDFAGRYGYTVRTSGGYHYCGPFAFRADQGWANALLFPGMLSGSADPALEVAAATVGGYQAHDLTAVGILMDGTLERLAEAGAAGAGAPDPYPAQDPTRSVPGLVAEVAAERGLSEDAAAIYLMLLALPNPADRKQSDWLGWKPARLKAARAELAGSGLVVSGSRPRAGRGLFLPGPWQPMTSPHPPVEKWKAEALGLTEEGGLVHGALLPTIPVEELYRAAWLRVRSGDGPRYEDLGERRGR